MILIVAGDKHYDIPNMKPLKFSHIVLHNEKDLQFVLYDVEVYGIETANVTHARLVFKNHFRCIHTILAYTFVSHILLQLSLS